MIALGLTATLLGFSLRGKSDGIHYHFAGPFSHLAAESSVSGKPATGIGFTLVALQPGSKLIRTRFDLKAPEWSSPITVSVEGARVENGHLKGTFKLINSSGFVLEGVRLDCDGATETYEAKGPNGEPVLSERAEPVSIASPILMGDVQSNDTADLQAFDAGQITFNRETKQVGVHFKLSGLTWQRKFVTHEGCGASVLSFDSKGRIYMSDRDGFWRCEVDGSKSTLITKYGDYTSDVIVDPTNDTVIGGPGNGTRFTRRDAAGNDISLVPVDEVFDHTPFCPAFRSNGDLYVKLDADLVVYRDGKEIKRVNKIGDASLATDGFFDVAADGSVAFVSQGSLYVSNSQLTTVKRITSGPDWHLGRIQSVNGVRRDAQGNLYVIEYAWSPDTPEPTRISVFDQAGNFVRVFGRADRTPSSDPEALKDGQLVDVHDIVFSKDGTMYVSSSFPNGGVINVFRAF